MKKFKLCEHDREGIRQLLAFKKMYNEGKLVYAENKKLYCDVKFCIREADYFILPSETKEVIETGIKHLGKGFNKGETIVTFSWYDINWDGDKNKELKEKINQTRRFLKQENRPYSFIKLGELIEEVDKFSGDEKYQDCCDVIDITKYIFSYC